MLIFMNSAGGRGILRKDWVCCKQSVVGGRGGRPIEERLEELLNQIRSEQTSRSNLLQTIGPVRGGK